MDRSLIDSITKNFWVRIIVIAAVTFICYSQALRCGYIWDDNYLVIENPFLHTSSGLQQLWFNFKSRSQYYPMVFSLFWIFYHLWKLNPFGYHFVNVLLHVFNAILIWRILKRLNVRGSYWAALIFAIHPVQAESVAWISELKNTLSTFFFLSSLRVYLELFREEWQWSWRPWNYIGALVLYIFALLSKTVACIFPVTILLILWWKRGTIKLKDVLFLISFFVIGMATGLVTVWMEVHRVGASGPEWSHTFGERLLIAGHALWFYLGKLVFPVNLVFTYPRWTIDPRIWIQYLYPLMFAGFLMMLWKMRSRLGRGPITAILYFCLALFPALGFFNLYPMKFSYVADHFQYLASIGPIALACAWLALLMEKLPSWMRKVLALIFVLIISCFCLLTWQQTFVYKDRLTLFNDVIKKNPSSWMAYNNRGSIFFAAKKYDMAEKDFHRALELNPKYADAWNNYGLIFYMRGELKDALEAFSQAVKFFPYHVEAYGNRGMVLRDMGDFQKAEEDFNRALKINPGYLKGYNRRAILFSMQDQNKKALQDIETLLKINPAFAPAYTNRAVILMKGNNYQSALKDLTHALRIDPDLVNAYFVRAEVFERLGYYEQALKDLSRAQALGAKIDPERLRQLKERG